MGAGQVVQVGGVVGVGVDRRVLSAAAQVGVGGVGVGIGVGRSRVARARPQEQQRQPLPAGRHGGAEWGGLGCGEVAARELREPVTALHPPPPGNSRMLSTAQSVWGPCCQGPQ